MSTNHHLFIEQVRVIALHVEVHDRAHGLLVRVNNGQPRYASRSCTLNFKPTPARAQRFIVQHKENAAWCGDAFFELGLADRLNSDIVWRNQRGRDASTILLSVSYYVPKGCRHQSTRCALHTATYLHDYIRMRLLHSSLRLFNWNWMYVIQLSKRCKRVRCHICLCKY